MYNKATTSSFVDHSQSFWELACIQSVSLGLPGILISSQVSTKIGTGTAITSVVLGNLIVWVIGLAIVSMAASLRENALENVKRYLGVTGGMISAIFLILAFITWYVIQIDSAVSSIDSIINLNENRLRLGAALGLFIALLSLGGIHLIKRLSLIVFPPMMGLIICAPFFANSSFTSEIKWGFSFWGILAISATTLPGIINLPTFFRHSRSIPDSFLGLSLMILFTTAFQLFPLIIGSDNFGSTNFLSEYNPLILIGFILLSLITTNLVNIYFASAGWEMILPHRKSTKEYAIVGLLGTAAYTFLQIPAPMEFIENMTDNFIACLGVILLMAFLVKIVVQHRPRPFEKLVNVGCWLFGGVFGTVAQSVREIDGTEAMIESICASLVAYLVVIFVEETVWSARKVLNREKE